MNYLEAIEATVSRETAKREIAKHDCDGWEVFLSEIGDKAEYQGHEILDWLGY